MFVQIGGHTEDNSNSLEVVHLTVSGHFVDVP